MINPEDYRVTPGVHHGAGRPAVVDGCGDAFTAGVVPGARADPAAGGAARRG